MKDILRVREGKMREREDASGLSVRPKALIEDVRRKQQAFEGFGLVRCPLDYCIKRQCAAFSRRQKRCLEGF